MSDESAETKTKAADGGQLSGGQSGTFTPPATQADLDRIIADRLARERAKFADYDDIKMKAAEYDKLVEASKTEAEKAAERLAELESKVKDYETREQVAAWKAEVSERTGVPVKVLAGATREEIEAHAESLKELITQPEQGPRPIPGEGSSSALALNGDGIEAALKKALGMN